MREQTSGLGSKVSPEEAPLPWLLVNVLFVCPRDPIARLIMMMEPKYTMRFRGDWGHPQSSSDVW